MVRQIETRLLREYLYEKYNDRLQWTNVPLGPVPFKEMARAFLVALRRADAIVKNGNELVIVETKVFPEFGGLAQLQAYRELLQKTPQFSEYQGLPVLLEYVTTKEDLDVRSQAEGQAIKYIIFRPDWIDAYEKEKKRIPPL